jgi:hypothetical protein
MKLEKDSIIPSYSAATFKKQQRPDHLMGSLCVQLLTHRPSNHELPARLLDANIKIGITIGNLDIHFLVFRFTLFEIADIKCRQSSSMQRIHVIIDGFDCFERAERATNPVQPFQKTLSFLRRLYDEVEFTDLSRCLEFR